MLKKYNPFVRGSYPVGVKSDCYTDETRGVVLNVEIWYPAAEKYAGMDLDPKTKDVYQEVWLVEGMDEESTASQDAVRDADAAQGKYPLVILAHGWAGHRRESTFIGTHLASYGYVVISADFPVGTFGEVDAFFTKQETIHDYNALEKHVTAIGESRFRDIPFLIDTVIEKERNIDIEAGIGITGASYGGWTSFMAPSIDQRVIASVPMCPGIRSDFKYESGPLNVMPEIDFSKYSEDTKTLILCADRDCIIPLQVQLENLKRLENEYRMVIMFRADHNHFVDDIDDVGQVWLKDFLVRLANIFPDPEMNLKLMAERCCRPGQLVDVNTAKEVWRGLILAHMDRVLKRNADASDFIRGDIDAATETIGAHTYTISK